VQRFKLIPFLAPKLPAIEFTGAITKQKNLLTIHYLAQGEIENILLPTPASPLRKHDLWKATCFELFLAVKGRPEYWEFNLSSSGDWNVYAMDAYRQVNMREEAAFTQLPFEFKKTDEELVLDISVDLSPILHPDQILQIGITSIIQMQDGNETYWALTHPSAQADFHLRESFLVNL
jgi:hypothetical protein